MGDSPEDHVLYTVTRAASGQWSVLHSGFREPLAFFRLREDAVEYAERLAGTKASAEVAIASGG